MSIIKDETLFESGELKIAWAEEYMDILNEIKKDFSKNQPFKGLKIALSIHLEAKTAVLCCVLAEAGAEMYITGSNPDTTQDDVAAALVKRGKNYPQKFEVFAKRYCTDEEYNKNLRRVIEVGPDLIIDDGGDLVHLIHTEFPELAEQVIGSCEETTTGLMRLRKMATAGELKFPVMAVNDADCKHLFDNHHGTGQSVLEGVMRATNLSMNNKEVVVAGFGDCGSGIAKRFDAMGAIVYVTEVNPVRALRADMEGYQVMTMREAAKIGDIFITATGCRDVITAQHFSLMKDGAILCNAGHFNVEIDINVLEEFCTKKRQVREHVSEYTLPSGNKVKLLAEGRLVNLVAADGHPVEIMDMSFAIQALSIKYLLEHALLLRHDINAVPDFINKTVAEIKLGAKETMYDSLSEIQKEYLGL